MVLTNLGIHDFEAMNDTPMPVPAAEVGSSAAGAGPQRGGEARGSRARGAGAASAADRKSVV